LGAFPPIFWCPYLNNYIILIKSGILICHTF
jgi:hypothetical protein